MSFPFNAISRSSRIWTTLLLPLALALCCGGCVSASKPFMVTRAAPGVYEGFRPRTREEVAALRAHGIRTILSVEAMPWNTYPERRHAEEVGLNYINIPIPASPLPPNSRRVKEVLQTLRQSSLFPIYLHCYLGRDRNAFLLGLYRVYYEGWTPQEAWHDMLRTGFKVRWSLRGLRVYFWAHCRIPAWARRAPPLPVEARRPPPGGLSPR